MVRFIWSGKTTVVERRIRFMVLRAIEAHHGASSTIALRADAMKKALVLDNGVRFTTSGSLGTRRPMGGSHAGEALGLGFDHGAKVLAAQGTLLLEIESDGRQSRGHVTLSVLRWCFRSRSISARSVRRPREAVLQRKLYGIISDVTPRSNCP